MIVEVLSASTERYDKGAKFELYKEISTLRCYVLVSNDRMCVEQYERTEEDQWKAQIYLNSMDELTLNTVGIKLPMHTLYEGVQLSKEL